MICVKFLVILALLHLGSSLPEPEPEANNNIQIDVEQEVQYGGCGNHGCPPPPPKRSCMFGGIAYSSDCVLTQLCMDIKCNDGYWEYTGKFNKDCGNCTFGGEPFIYTFDPLKNMANPSVPITYYNLDAVDNYTMVKHDEEFGVNAQFSNWVDGDCPWVDCINGTTYYEPGITVTMGVPSVTCTDPFANDPECAIKVWVNGIKRTIGKKIDVFWGTDGAILVFKHKHIMDPENKNCISVIGTKGLTVAVCERVFNHKWWPWHDESDPWSYVLAQPSLFSTPSQLHGMCNTITGHSVDFYIASDGTGYNSTQCFPYGWNPYPADNVIQCTGFTNSWKV